MRKRREFQLFCNGTWNVIVSDWGRVRIRDRVRFRQSSKKQTIILARLGE